jgi:two-component system sensor histidine kinase PilS (NtrC family)
VWYSWVRLVVYTVFYFGVLAFQLRHGDFLCLELWQPLHLLMALACAAHVLFLEWGKGESKARWGVEALSILDVVAVSWVWSLTNLSVGPFVFGLLFFTLASGLLLGLKPGLRVAGLGLVAFNFSLALNPFVRPEDMTLQLIVANVATLFVAGLSSLLGEQVQAAGVDIKEKAEEIQALTDINELIVEHIPSGLLLVDSHLRVLRANRGAVKIFSDLALEARPLHEISLDLEILLQNFAAKPSAGGFGRYELAHYNYKKEKLILEVIVSAIAPRQSDDGRYLVLLQNLTEVKNLEFAMQQKEKLAAVGQLAAGIAHEIRNPLASISGSVQLLQGNLQVQSDEDKKLLAIMVKEIDRLNRLITEFLDFVRPETRVEDPIHINSLAREVLDMVKLNDKLSKKVEQRTELRAQGLIGGHYDKLKQALMNIVINAYQAMNDTLRPEIFIQSFDREDRVVLVIQDNGMGMTKETLRRLFEPFHTTKARGTGLGLAITHKIIESHGARIDIESELGQGAKFLISFPALPSPEKDELPIKKHA